jgi:hypothetical protein
MISRILKAVSMSSVVAALCVTLTVLPVAGCSSADVQKAVSLIAAELPTAIAIAGELAPLIGSLSGTQTATTGQKIQADLVELQTLVNDYNKPGNSSSVLASTFGSITNVVDDLVVNGDAALLSATHITNPASQTKVTAILTILSVALHVIDGYVQATQTTTQVKATAAKRTVKLKQVSAYYSDSDKEILADAFGYSYNTLYNHEVALGF